MAIKCDEYGNVCVVTIDGDLAGDAPAVVRRAADERIDDEPKPIVDFGVDLEKTGFIDSDGLETLLWLKRRCEDRLGRVKLAGADATCQKILEMTRLAHRFECHPDLPAALKAMRH